MLTLTKKTDLQPRPLTLDKKPTPTEKPLNVEEFFEALAEKMGAPT